MFTIFICMILLPIATYYQDNTPKLSLSNVQISKPQIVPERELIALHDEADVNFNIQFDLTNTFKWTTKELYLSLIAVWEDSVGPQEQTIWDRTFFYTDKASFIFSDKQVSKYTLRSYEGAKLATCDIHFKFLIYEVGFGGMFRQFEYNVDDIVVKVE